MTEKKIGFFAYSSFPASSGQAVEKAISTINSEGNVTIKSWINLKNSGKFIINEIIDEIDNSDFFCADLTGMNNNVLFEIGYAISKQKPILLILDTSHQESIRKFRELSLLSSIGYSKYTNSNNITRKFNSEKVYQRTNNSLQLNFYENGQSSLNYVLLLLKGPHDTDYNQLVLNQIKDEYKLSYLLDDASEEKTQTLPWYLEKLSSTSAIIAEFCSTERTYHEIQNLKCSLISGIALGLNKRLLMIAEEPYNTPLDYKEILKKFNNIQTCKTAIQPFLSELKDKGFEYLSKKNPLLKKSRYRNAIEKIHFGEFQAEHEINQIQNYYIDYLDVESLIRNEYNIVVGRKGSGKTASLYFLKSIKEMDKRNFVCVIKPVSFEIDALIYLLNQSNQNFEKSNLIESVWKFLIYTEIAKSAYESINSRPVFTYSNAENNFIRFVEEEQEILLTDFSVRLENELCNISETSFNSIQEYKLRISELLHMDTLRTIKDYIKDIFHNKKHVFVLIDNLDKSWNKSSNLRFQSEFILGLLGVTGRIIQELSSSKGFDFHLTIFLRSDIFDYIMDVAREPDKIEHTRIKWNDKDALFRVIEERFINLYESDVKIEDFWSNYIISSIDGMPIKDYIYQRIIPRPRDIIYFLRNARDKAVIRGHEKISADDIEDAYAEYSSWVFKSILVENGITLHQMESLLYEFVASSIYVDSDFVLECIKNADIDIDKQDYVIDRLVYLSFLGREIMHNQYAYEYDFEGDKKYKIMARKLNPSYTNKRFCIHKAFTKYLECSEA